MKRTYLLVVLSFLALSAIWMIGYGRTGITYQARANAGVIDLTHVDWSHDAIVQLDGQWEFYWKQFLAPADFIGTNKKPTYRMVPSEWTSKQLSDAVHSNYGYATYRLRILTAKEDEGRIVGLEIPNVATSYRLYVNGVFREGNGMVADRAATMIPENYPRPLYFQLQGQSNEIVIQVANYVQRKSGLWDSFRLGNADTITYDREKRLAVDLLITASLLTMGIYHLVLFFQRRQDRAKLYLGLFCLAITLRTAVTGEILLIRFFPMIPWEIQTRIEYLSVSLGLFFLVSFVRTCYPNEQIKWIHTTMIRVLVAFSVFCLVTPARVYTYWMLPFQLLALFGILYIVFVFVKAYIRKREGADFNVLGLLIFFLATCNDVLYYNHVWKSTDLIPLGMVFFVMMQTIQQSVQFSNSFSQIEQLSIELQSLNESLEQKIAKRTLALAQSNQNLVHANEELTRMEESRRTLMSNISHELGTPLAILQGYVVAIRDRIDVSKQDRFLQIIYDKTLILKTIIQDLFELSKLEAGQILFDIQCIELLPELEKLSEKFELQMQEAGITFRFEDGSIKGMEPILVYMDAIRISQAFSNLITNAIKHTPQGGEIRMVIEPSSAQEGEKVVTIHIADSGSGISDEDLPYVFERFYKSSDPRKARIGGTGLGLAICKEIVDRHNGMLTVSSKIGKGSTFSITLPVAE